MGGQPSTTQPIATPWLSPKVVTRNMWPKVLKDIGARSVPACGNARGAGGQTRTLPVIPGWSEGPDPESRDSQVRKGAPGSVLRIAPE
ncbi:hypothetical protein BRDID11004_58890 [Bradyrhizobium diazoefficiens]